MNLTAKLIFAAFLAVATIAAAFGHPLPFVSPESLAFGGAILASNFVQEGDTLDLDPGGAVAAGTGHLFGAALFGVALTTGANGVKSAFRMEGVVTIAKTSALAISVGDRLFWDATNSVVNKTTTAQQQVGIAVEAAANPSATVKMLLESALPVAT